MPRLDIVLQPSTDGSSFDLPGGSAAQASIRLPEGAAAQDFFVDSVTWQLPQATVTRARTCAQLVTRGAAEIARDDAPTIRIYLHIEGSLTGIYDGRTERFGPGDVVIHDSTRGHDSASTGLDLRILMMARDRVPLGLLSPPVHGLRLAGDRAGTRLLASAIKELVQAMDELTLLEADHAVMAIYALAAGLAEAEICRRDRARRRFADAQLDGAIAFIERSFSDPRLSAETLRQHLGLSRTAIYRLFEPLGGIGVVIRQRRLDAAMRSLLTGIDPGPGVAALTAQHGFSSEVHLNRAFKARFGATPVQFRKMVERGNRAWLKDQAARAGFASLEAWFAALTSGDLSE